MKFQHLFFDPPQILKTVMFLFKNSPYATLVPCSLTVSKYANIAFLMVIFILLLWFNWKTTDDVSTYHIQQGSYWIDIYTRSRWHRNKYVWTAIGTMLMCSLKAQLRENQIRGQRRHITTQEKQDKWGLLNFGDALRGRAGAGEWAVKPAASQESLVLAVRALFAFWPSVSHTARLAARLVAHLSLQPRLRIAQLPHPLLGASLRLRKPQNAPRGIAWAGPLSQLF